MSQRKTVERAFQLARGGTCQSVNDIREHLKREGCTNYDEHLAGPLIRKQLLALMKH